MTSTSPAGTTLPAGAPSGPGSGVVVAAWLTALWCLAFAAVNVAFELTGRFADGPYAAYASGLAVMNLFVVVLKVVGAAAALASVTRRRVPVAPGALNVLLWTAFATLGVYAVGSLGQAVALTVGVWGSAGAVGPAGVAYVLLGLAGAAGFGVLAVSHSRRCGLGALPALLGAVAAPLVLGLVLLVVPALLVAVGVMPAY